MNRFTLVTLSALVFFSLACDEKKDASRPADTATATKTATSQPSAAPKAAAQPVAQDPVVEAKNVFEARCVTCHGASGKGDGIAAANINPKPRDYADKEWQASVDDEYLAKVILEGGPAMGKSPMMAGNPDLKAKPEVVAALVKIVRSFAAE